MLHVTASFRNTKPKYKLNIEIEKKKKKLASNRLIDALYRRRSHTQHSSRAYDTTRKSRQYSDTSFRYQLKMELHTGLDTRRLYPYAKLGFKQITLRK